MTTTDKGANAASDKTTMLGTSIVGTSSVRNYSDAKILIISPGHAVYVGKEASQSNSDEYWKGGFKGEAPYYTQHALAAIEEAGKGQHFLLVFSGGQTRETAGVMSEAQSYWFLGQQYNWNNRVGLEKMATVDDFARDSFENVAFSVGKFVMATGRMPLEIVICGWGFKEARYRMHADALGIRQDKLHYINVNNPEGSAADVSSPLGGALKGEKKTIMDFFVTPFGNSGILLQKKLQRDPYIRGDAAYRYYNLNELFPLLRQ